MGAKWEFALDPDTELTVRYDSAERSYDVLGVIEETRLEARLSFEL
jgi:hypothetical protein